MEIQPVSAIMGSFYDPRDPRYSAVASHVTGAAYASNTKKIELRKVEVVPRDKRVHETEATGKEMLEYRAGRFLDVRI